MTIDLANSRHVLVIFLLLFLAYFLPLPLDGQLPGNVDTLLGIALSNLTRETLGLVFSGTATNTIFYPEPSFIPYGENCFGLIASFLIFKTLAFGSDVWGYYLLTSSLSALSAFGVYKLTSLFVRNRAIAALAGLAFTLAGFTLGNIDDLNVTFVFLPALSLYFLELGIREKKSRHVTIGFALAGAQVWFGFYVFLFQTLALAVFVLANARSLLEFLDLKAITRAFTAFAVTAFPLVALYFYYHLEFRPSSVYEVYNEQMRQITSLKAHHFGNTLENNRLYSSVNNVYDGDDVSITSRFRKACFPGFLFAILFAVGLVKSWKKTTWLFLTFVLFLTLSFGSNSPVFTIFETLPLGNYLRIPLRFYLFALMMGSVYFSIGAEALATRVKNKAVLLAILAIVLLETTPFPLKGYALADSLTAPESYVRHFKDRPTRAVVFDLPSNLRQVFGKNGDGDAITTFSREILYMNWQTQHRQIIAGGVSGYQPDARNDLDRLAARLPNLDVLQEIKDRGVTHLVFHKHLVMLPSEDVLAGLKAAPMLTKEFEDDRTTIFAYSTPGY